MSQNGVRSSFLVLVSCILLTELAGNPAAARQGLPADSLQLSVDYARFRGDAQNLYVEFYYSFSQRSITYRPDSTGISGGLDLSITIRRGASVAFADRWIVPHHSAAVADSGAGVHLVSVSAVQLPEGEYTVSIVGRDRYNPSRKDSVTVSLPVKVIDTTRVVLSDLQLANTIVEGSPSSPFYKNTLEVIPNAQGVFGEHQVCYVYAEAYNLLAGTDRSDYVVKTVVWDAVKHEVLSRIKKRRRFGESAVLVDRITIASLPTGSYVVGVAVLDTAGRTMTSAAKKFFVYNETLGFDSTLVVAGRSLLPNVYEGMSEGDLEREFDLLRYERTDEEKRMFGSLTGVDAKRAFFQDFWKRRPEGLREDYLGRTEVANSQFRVLGREGFETDRGRVYIVYGPPDDYERHPNEPGTRPYEIWTYNNIQGGVTFVFVQRISGGQYELVHSTHRNELRDDLWFQHYAQTAR
jgi:GWxTD domain-containing protein